MTSDPSVIDETGTTAEWSELNRCWDVSGHDGRMSGLGLKDQKGNKAALSNVGSVKEILPSSIPCFGQHDNPRSSG